MSAAVAHDEVFALFQIARFGACATRTDGTVVFWNRRAEQIAGVPAAQAIGRRFRDLIGPAAAAPSTATDSEHEAADRSPIVLAGQPAGSLVLHIFDDDTPTAAAALHNSFTAAPTSADAASGPAPEWADHIDHQSLSRRELQILRMMASGTATEEISEELEISVHTVRNHVRNLRVKLDAKTKMEAVATAFRLGLL